MIERLFAIINVNANDVNIPNVLADTSTFNSIVGLVYAAAAAISLFFIVRGALLFVTSGSDPSSVKSARETILYAIIGLVGSTMVFGIIQYVIKSVGA